MIVNELFNLFLVTYVAYSCGLTVEKFCLRWKIINTNKLLRQKVVLPSKITPSTFSELNHHGLYENCEIRLTDKTDPSDPTRGVFLDPKA